MEQRSLRVVETHKTFFSKITNSISKLLENMNVKVSKIAHGIPIGVDMEYIDALTLELALEDRKKISN